MPKGYNGQKRPGDVIGAAIMVAKIATGETAENADESKVHHRNGGLKGGVSSASRLARPPSADLTRSARLAYRHSGSCC